ncbi:sulfotransferase [Thalassotalea sp. PS06]|uniref:sulfotransferase n=1 Tax=Thalassotalea sp. PS06 TaxID=2594005 RepID=UPI0011626A44|nr:sulfotransferase [Thalassotalea sp. PS06]QDP01108.1 sulfotransferase family protein [Thalassotalea sp. PS06]
MQINSNQPKLFVVSLPRTATTSFCLAMLEQGLKVAHTAYTLKTFNQADVIADTPIFNDYRRLDSLFPNARFIYLERDIQSWLPSIRQLLQRMQTNLQRTDGGFNPILKRCYADVFSQYSLEMLADDAFLIESFNAHQQQVFDYFAERPTDFTRLSPDQANWWQTIESLLDWPLQAAPFPHVNKGGKVTKWNELRHPLKIESTRNGRVDDLDKLLYRL